MTRKAEGFMEITISYVHYNIQNSYEVSQFQLCSGYHSNVSVRGVAM